MAKMMRLQIGKRAVLMAKGRVTETEVEAATRRRTTTLVVEAVEATIIAAMDSEVVGEAVVAGEMAEVEEEEGDEEVMAIGR